MAEPTDGDREIAVVIADKYSGARLYAAIAEAIAVARDEGRREERIADRLAEEADLLPCGEDAAVYRSAAVLVRADFSHEKAEELETGNA